MLAAILVIVIGTELTAADTLTKLRQQRTEAAHRARRILYNNDGDDHILDVPASVEAFLAKRTTPLLDSHVDTIVYCTSRPFGVFTHNTKVGDALTTKAGYTPPRNNITGDFIAQGTDTLRIMIECGHKHGKEVFWSMRMNDTHDAAHPPDKPQRYWSAFKEQHQDWLFGSRAKRPPYGRWSGVDYAEPVVRDFLFRFVEEVCRNYDVDGIELDFLRHEPFFKTVANGGLATSAEVSMMTDLLRRLRVMTETEGLRRGRPILVAVRVLDSVGYCRDMGLDIEVWLKERLIDLLVTTDYHRLNPWEYSVKLGHKYNVPVYPCLSDPRVRGETRFKRNSIEAYRGRAMNAWAAGADGIHIFNNFNPRHPIWWELGDLVKLRTLDKLYFVTVRDGDPNRFLANGSRHRTVPVLAPSQPARLSVGQPYRVSIVVGDDWRVAQQASVKPTLSCHLQIPGVTAPEQVAVKFNNHALRGGTAQNGWVDLPLPVSLVRQGANQVAVSLNEAADAKQLWDAVYACAEKMPAPWSRSRAHNNTSAVMRDKALVIADTGKDTGSYLYYTYPWNADIARPAVVEAEAKVLSGRSSIIVANGAAEEEVHLLGDRIKLRHAGLAHRMNTTDAFHTYRVEIQGKDIRVFVDGVLQLDGTGKFTRAAASKRNVVLFGAANSTETGAAAWKNVRLRTGSRLLYDLIVSVQYR